MDRHHCSSNLTGWNRGEYNAPNTLVQASEENIAFHGACFGIFEDTLIVWGLDAGFQCVEWVDYEVYDDCCKCTGLV